MPAVETRELASLERQPTDAPPEPHDTLPTQTPQEVICGQSGQYDLMQVVGRGGMGVVYLARHRSLGCRRAVKTILNCTPQALVRFRTEEMVLSRLHHPNIVQLFEIWEDQEQPYFAMEWVNGPTLDKRLHNTPLRAKDAARLLVKLAQAVQAAHDAGIIHRDLKPANVLLEDDRAAQSAGPEAEEDTLDAKICSLACPKIADFGLAKNLDVGEGQSHTGDILGTPSFMAPEQAEGKREIREAADIYALGAILYKLLTGQPPFVGATLWDTLDMVRHKEPVAPHILQPKVPRDVETICLKCLRKEPDKRYASAQALAEDLERHLRGEPILARPAGRLERAWKWCRRNKALTALFTVLALAAVVLSGMGVVLAFLYASEREQRQQAEENFHATLAAVDSALMADEAYLGEVAGIQAFRTELVRRVFPPLEKLIARYGSDPRFREELALLHHRAGELQLLVGNRAKAAEHLQAAVELRTRLDEEQPNTPTLQAARATSLQSLGNLLNEKGERAPALECLQEARRLRGALFQHQPEDLAARVRLAESNVDWALAVRSMPGRLDEAIGSLKEAIALLEPHQSNSACWPCLAHASSRLAGFLSDQGHKEDARLVYESAIRLRELLYQAEPGKVTYLRDLAETCNDAGWLLHQIGAPREAKARYQRALELRAKLAKENPGVPRFQHLLALTANNMGLLHLIWSGQVAQANKYFLQAQEVREGLPPGSVTPVMHNSLGHVLQNKALAQRYQGRKQEALRLLGEVLRIRERTLKGDANNPLFRRHHAYTLGVRGEVYLEVGDLSAADADLHAALTVHRQLASRNPGRADLQDDLALNLLRLGRLRRRQGRHGEARQAATEALQITVTLPHDTPEYVRHHALALAEAGDLDGDGNKIREAIALCERICGQQPEFWEHLEAHAACLLILGKHARRHQDFSSAQQAWEQARHMLTRLRQAEPGMPDFASSLAVVLGELGQFALDQGRRTDAVRFAMEAIDVQQQALQATTEVPCYQEHLTALERLLQQSKSTP